MDELTREFLIESQDGLDRMERCLTDLEDRPQDSELLGEIFRSVHTIKGTTGFLGFQRLERLAHAGENLLGMLREGKVSASREIVTGLLQLMDGLRAILKTIEEDESEGEEEDSVLIAHLAQLQQPVADTAVPMRESVFMLGSGPGSSGTAALPDVLSFSPPIAVTDPELTADVVRTAVPAVESTLRVDVVLLNRMMNLVGELVLTRNQILQVTTQDPSLTVLSRRLDMVTADLRESVMKARMQPVSHVFAKFPRIVRDLSQLLDRRVRLVMEGQDTELDKSLLEAIKDPLTHAVRNALDHGIESPEVRIASGKDPEGTLRLRAYQESSYVLIELSDDGAGIQVENVRSKAIERGLISAERAAHLDERELLQLIFLPGFSTAAAITNVSGRGVGMDVVRTNVEKIGGKVELESLASKGTTLRLRIPLTLAIIPVLIVRTLDQSFAIPQSALSELIRIPWVPRQTFVRSGSAGATGGTLIEWVDGIPLYRLRGRLLPLIFLDQMLSPGIEADHRATRDRFIAVLEANGRRFGLVVDALADPEEIVVKPLSAVLKSIGVYSGATVLGSGDLALILDPSFIAARARFTLSPPREPLGAKLGKDMEASKVAGPQYLLVETSEGRAAFPLNAVLRIERIPMSRIEYLGSRPILNFDGQLLPVEDSCGAVSAATAMPDTVLTVVICSQGTRQVGVAVHRVLDVAPGSALFEAGCFQPADRVTQLRNQVTVIMDLNAIPALQIRQGVDLVSDLASGSERQHRPRPDAEPYSFEEVMA